ncbi:hypothetical protein [Helicobacter pylori]|uniref:hypothetical protein n=1 Tax=Helicobacter pylori TaxID=210 RepID=UPI000FDEC2EF|nr:hypothetical protein [Helicobacter pylori]RVY51436.1 hypothetical protein ECC23_01320 [Helicobacter pylori]
MAIRFGVIFIVDFLRVISVDDENKQLRSIFVVFTDESDAIFNLKNYLLVLSKNFNSRNIWYCENFVCNKESTYNIEIELVSNENDFGEVLDIVKDTSNKDIFNHNDLPHDLPQFFTNLMNKQIEFYFHKRINNDGLPFGIIFIVGDPIDIDNKTEKLQSCFCSDKNSRFSYFPIITEDYLILDNLKSCFVFQCEPNKNDRPFNLKQYLLGLKVNLGFEPTGIFYCENANTHKIELIGNDSDFKGVLLEFLENIPQAPNELPQFLTNFKNSKSPNEKISFNFTSNKNSSISPYAAFNRKVRDTFDCYCWHGYSKIPQEKRIAKIQEQVNEEIKLDPSFCNHRVSSEQNRKINEIAEGLKSGKIIGEKIIANAFDLNAGYCFITPDDLKNLLKERLFIQQDIINAINQRVILNHAQINDIKYNLLDNAFYFIFDIDNSPQLAIKVLRKYLENDELPNTKKNIFKRLIGNIHACIDDESSFFLENNKTIDDLNLEDLLGRLKTQAFPLSDTITNAINEKEEGVVLDYALINDIKYNLLDNTFHFIFNVGNSLLKESSQLIIEVPREALDLENIDRLIKNTLLSHRVCFCSEIYSVCSENSLICHLNKGSYIIDLHLMDD